MSSGSASSAIASREVLHRAHVTAAALDAGGSGRGVAGLADHDGVARGVHRLQQQPDRRAPVLTKRLMGLVLSGRPAG